MEAEMHSGDFRCATESPTILQAVEQYEAYVAMECNASETLTRYKTVMRHLLLFAAQQNALRISHVNLPFLDAYRQARLGKGREPTTVHKETIILKQLLNFAVSRGLLAKNPLQGTKLKAPPARTQPCWTWPEVQAILSAAAPPHRAALTMLAETGMRIGELRHLTWKDVNFERNVILIRPKKFFNPATGATEVWKPKTGKPRTIPMNELVRQLLADASRSADWVVTSSAAPHSICRARLSPRTLATQLKKILGRLGLKGHLHTFRHAFVSNALIKGTPEATVREWVGHIKPEILRIYTHIADHASQDAMHRLAAANLEAEPGKEPTYETRNFDAK
jgi:integrase